MTSKLVSSKQCTQQMHTQRKAWKRTHMHRSTCNFYASNHRDKNLGGALFDCSLWAACGNICCCACLCEYWICPTCKYMCMHECISSPHMIEKNTHSSNKTFTVKCLRLSQNTSIKCRILFGRSQKISKQDFLLHLILLFCTVTKKRKKHAKGLTVRHVSEPRPSEPLSSVVSGATQQSYIHYTSCDNFSLGQLIGYIARAWSHSVLAVSMDTGCEHPG